MKKRTTLFLQATVALTALIGSWSYKHWVIGRQAAEPAQRLAESTYQTSQSLFISASLPPRANSALPEMRSFLNLVYARPGGQPLLLDIFAPPHIEGAAPLIVWIHGGAWMAGDKELCPAVFLVPRGYVVASISYRLCPTAVFPAQIEDCKAAVRWLRANAAQFRINPDRIGVWGMSAGGHLAALLGTSGDVKELEGDGDNMQVSSRVQAVCDWFGPTDLLRLADHVVSVTHDTTTTPLDMLFGGPIHDRKQLAIQANPLTSISKDDPPFLIMHGDKDPLVPIEQSQSLHLALKMAGVNSTMRVIKGAEHGFWDADVQNMVIYFFSEKLKHK